MTMGINTRNTISFSAPNSIGAPPTTRRHSKTSGANMRKAISIAAIVAACVATANSAHAQANPGSAAAAEERFQIKHLYKRSLHQETNAFPDGAKGVSSLR